MANVLTTGSNIDCGHQGSVALSGAGKLKVGGNPVVLQGDIGPGLSIPCTLQPSTNTKPCTTATPSGGASQKLMVGGTPVMLDSVSVTTDGQPAGVPVATASQSKLTAS
jgi:hypothetical protein